MAGRPTKYNPERVKTICDSLAEGLPRWVASTRAGIDIDTLDRWVHRYAEFAAALKVAEAEAVARNVAIIQRAAITSWQAAAWWLERRYSEEFSRRLEITYQRSQVLDEARQLARRHGIDEGSAVREAERILDDVSKRR